MDLMSIVGATSEPTVFEYSENDVILYALGVGAQQDELQFVYENVAGGLKVIPSFGVLARAAMPNLLGEEVDQARVLHGEQTIRVHGPIPPSGSVVVVGSVTDVFDKGKAAVIHSQTESRLPDGELLFETQSVGFYLGEGGFGGPRGPKAEKLEPPEGVDPDFSVSYETSESQAALYRLNGDLNPLHIDPSAAQRVGFDRPILHGLCTYGFATRAIVHGLCDGDPSRFRAFRARFSNAVFPGETITTEGWKQRENRYIIQVRTEREVVISNAFAEVA
jgi:acyl dehydratase